MNAQTKLPATWRSCGNFHLLLMLTVALLLMVPVAAFSDELVVNGDFEQPDLEELGVLDEDGNGWTTFFGQNVDEDYCETNGFEECHGGTLVPGWEVYWSDSINEGVLKPGRLEIQRNLVAGCMPCSQNQKAELDSHHRPDSSDCNVTLMQRINTCPRMPYTLSFSWRPRTEVGDDSNMLVLVDDDTVLRSTSTDTYWTDETYNFIAGDDFESLLVFEAFGHGNTYGMLLDNISVQGQDGENPNDCQPIEICGSKPANLELLYNGSYGDGDYHMQDPDEVVIETFTGDPLPDVVFIKVYDHRYGNRNAAVLFAEEVRLGETFPVLNDYSEWKMGFVPPRISIEILDSSDGMMLQRVTFHTSCSQPLNVADQFGGIAVWGFTPRETVPTTMPLLK